MTIICVINGENIRMGQLFKTPKHLLLYRGKPALYAAIDYFKQIFIGAEIIIMAGKQYSTDINFPLIELPETKSIVHALLLHPVTGPVMFVDCDIIPIELNKPIGNMVYLFKNEDWMKQYSNYLVVDGKVVDCNEKGKFYHYAGAGIYYFENAQDFYDNAEGCTSISQVVKKLPFNADTTSKIFRFGTLNDIKNDNQSF